MHVTSRRAFLQRATGTAALAAIARPDLAARVAAASASVAGHTAADVAADEDFWREIQEGFTLDRTLINLNNGGGGPSPRGVPQAVKRHPDIPNPAPADPMGQGPAPEHRAGRPRLGGRFRGGHRRPRNHAQ